MLNEEFSRSQVSAAVRPLFPGLVMFYAGLGTGYLTLPGEVRESPGILYIVDQVIPIDMYGMFYIAVSMFGVIAMISKNRVLGLTTLAIMGSTMVVWCLLMVWAIFEGYYSFGSVMFPALAVLVCYACARSLLNDEVPRGE